MSKKSVKPKNMLSALPKTKAKKVVASEAMVDNAVMDKPKRGRKPNSSKNESVANYPKFRYWLMDNNITQKELAKTTHLSVNTVYRLTHFGKGTKSIILLVSLVLHHIYKLDINEQRLTEMLIVK